MKKEVKTNKHVKAKNKKTKIILGSGLCMQEQACIRRFLPRNPKNTKTWQNLKTEILAT